MGWHDALAVRSAEMGKTAAAFKAASHDERTCRHVTTSLLAVHFSFSHGFFPSRNLIAAAMV